MKQERTPAFALDQTLAAYGIQRLPFPIDQVDDFYFATPTLAKQSDSLRSLVEYSDLILVVSGVEGAGKSAFLDQFLLGADSRWRVARIDARQATTLALLVESLLAGFGVTHRAEDAPGDEALLRTFLTEVHAGGNVALAVVDDAHLLPQICTEFLVALAEDHGRMNLRLLLATEPGRLGFATDDPARVHVIVLQPFDAQQSADYIHTRLSYAGLVGDSPFDAATMANIHQDSAGLPGAIHPLALHTLLASAHRARPRGSGIPGSRRLAYAAGLLILIAGASWLLAPEPEPGPLVTTRTAPPAGAVRGRVQGLPAPAPGPETGTSVAPAASPAPVEPFATAVTPKAAGEPPAAAAAGVNRAPAGPGVGGPSLRPAVAVTAPAPTKTPPEADHDVTLLRLAGNVTPASSGTPAKPVPAIEPPRDITWLRAQDPAHHVIQLLGGRDRAAVGRFLDTHRLGAQGAWFATTHQGQPWFVVVYGLYPDRASARAAIGTLPADLRAGSPWARSIGSIIANAR